MPRISNLSFRLKLWIQRWSSIVFGVYKWILTTISCLLFSVIANRTRSFGIAYTIDPIDVENQARIKFPLAELIRLLQYIASCCPNLEKMLIRYLLQGEYSDEDFKVLSNWLCNTIKALITESGSMVFQCDLTIYFQAFFPEPTLMVTL